MVVEVAVAQGQVNIHQATVQASPTALLILQGRPTLQRMHTAVMPLQKIHTPQPVKVVHLIADQEIILQTLLMVLVILSLIRGVIAEFFFLMIFLELDMPLVISRVDFISDWKFTY